MSTVHPLKLQRVVAFKGLWASEAWWLEGRQHRDHQKTVRGAKQEQQRFQGQATALLETDEIQQYGKNAPAFVGS